MILPVRICDPSFYSEQVGRRSRSSAVYSHSERAASVARVEDARSGLLSFEQESVLDTSGCRVRADLNRC